MPVRRSSEDSGQSGSQSCSQRVVVSAIVSTVPHPENNLVDIPRRVQSRKRTKSEVSGGNRIFSPSEARSTTRRNHLHGPKQSCLNSFQIGYFSLVVSCLRQ